MIGNPARRKNERGECVSNLLAVNRAGKTKYPRGRGGRWCWWLSLGCLLPLHAAAQPSDLLFGGAQVADSMVSAGGALSLEPFGSGAGLDAGGAEAVAEASSEELAKIIPTAFRIRVGVGALYDDNIYQSADNAVGTYTVQEQLGVLWNVASGGHSNLSLSYDAVAFQYPELPDLNAINHAVAVVGGLEAGKFQLGLSGNYRRVAGGDTGYLRQATSSSEQTKASDTAGTVDQNTQRSDQEVGQFSVSDQIAFALSAGRPIATKMALNSALNYSATLYQDADLQSSQTLSASLGLSYQLGAKTTVGLTGVLSYLENGDNPSQTSEQILLTAGYQATGKLTFAGSAGVDFRQYGRSAPVAPPVAAEAVPVAASAIPEMPMAAAEPAVTIEPVTPPTDPGGTGAMAAAPAPGDSTTAGETETPSPPVTVASPAAVTAVTEEPVPVAIITYEPSSVIDYTQDSSAEIPDSTGFVFNLSTTYQLRLRTALRLSAARTKDGSASLGTSGVQNTTFSLGLDQLIGRRFAVGLTGGYQLSDYGELQGVRIDTDSAGFSTRTPVTLERAQKYWYGQASLNFQPRENTSIGMFYEFRTNDGGNVGLDYESNRVGVQCTLSF